MTGIATNRLAEVLQLLNSLEYVIKQRRETAVPVWKRNVRTMIDAGQIKYQSYSVVLKLIQTPKHLFELPIMSRHIAQYRIAINYIENNCTDKPSIYRAVIFMESPRQRQIAPGVGVAIFLTYGIDFMNPKHTGREIIN